MGGIDLEWIKPRVCIKENTQVATYCNSRMACELA